MSWEQHDQLLKMGGQSVANGVILNGQHVGQYGADGFACNEAGEAALKAHQAAEAEAKAAKAEAKTPKAAKAPKAETPPAPAAGGDSENALAGL